MPSNFTLGHKTAGTAQIMSGTAMACVDQDPTGSWVAVDFGTPADQAGGVGEKVVHIETTAALRFRVGASAPVNAGTKADVGTLIQAGGSRTISMPGSDSLWIKS